MSSILILHPTKYTRHSSFLFLFRMEMLGIEKELEQNMLLSVFQLAQEARMREAKSESEKTKISKYI